MSEAQERYPSVVLAGFLRATLGSDFREGDRKSRAVQLSLHLP